MKKQKKCVKTQKLTSAQDLAGGFYLMQLTIPSEPAMAVSTARAILMILFQLICFDILFIFFGDNIAVYPPLDSPPRVGGRRGVLASDATTETLGSPRSAEGFSPRRGGGGTIICTRIPPPLRSSPYY